MKRLLLIFGIAFVLNAIWENVHSLLYTSHKGGAITEFILLRASLFDAFVITILAIPFLFIPYLKARPWLFLIVGTIVAIVNEWYGLSTARWAYNDLMPVIPIIETGLTPTVQLGLLGYISLLFCRTQKPAVV